VKGVYTHSSRAGLRERERVVNELRPELSGKERQKRGSNRSPGCCGTGRGIFGAEEGEAADIIGREKEGRCAFHIVAGDVMRAILSEEGREGGG